MIDGGGVNQTVRDVDSVVRTSAEDTKARPRGTATHRQARSMPVAIRGSAVELRYNPDSSAPALELLPGRGRHGRVAKTGTAGARGTMRTVHGWTRLYSQVTMTPRSNSTDTVEAWAKAYILSDLLDCKIAPPPPPDRWRPESATPPPSAPGRPPELRVSATTRRAPRATALTAPRPRAELLHRFWHHELQAAELMCWALLKFADAEQAFREGLLQIARDEMRHMSLYQAHLGQLGFSIGDFPVRDWFWERVPSCATKLSFVALMGLGLEAANLEHAQRFAAGFRRAGDERGAALQEQILEDEIAHVRFGREWFERWTGPLRFDAWRSALPPPLSPLLMRGTPLNHGARQRAGLSPQFLETLSAWQPEDSGS
jgi:uncharacterized ferritin-like protein (DUF455 family)